MTTGLVEGSPTENEAKSTGPSHAGMPQIVGCGVVRYDDHPLRLKARTLKTEVIRDPDLWGSVWRGPSARNTLPSSERRTIKVLLRAVGFQRRQRTDHTTLS